MVMEPVRVLVKERKGIILNAQLEAAVKILSEFIGVDVTVCKGFLLKTASIYGHDCVLVDSGIYPVVNTDHHFPAPFPVKVVDFSQTVRIGGEVYAG